MHNLRAKFARIYDIAKKIFSSQINEDGNFYNYPHKPMANDLTIMSLSLAAEALSIDSENLLFATIKAHEPDWFATLGHRCNFNRRRRRLVKLTDTLASHLASAITPQSTYFIIDSMPLPVCRFVRNKKLKILKDNKEMQPKTSWLHIDRVNFHGYKLHCLINQRGVITNWALTSAEVHDVKMLKPLTEGIIEDCVLIGDKGYISAPIQFDLFSNHEIEVVTPLRKNQMQDGLWTDQHGRRRKRIETMFSQFCDQFNIKKNYAKSFSGYLARVGSKIAAFSVLQYINFLNNRPINRVKTALWL